MLKLIELLYVNIQIVNVSPIALAFSRAIYLSLLSAKTVHTLRQ